MEKSTWQMDREFTEKPLKSVRKEPDGYALERVDDWGTLWIADPGFEPKVGQMARYYGKGDGFPVRGVVIDGRVVRYQTAAEAEAERVKQSEAFEQRCAKAEADAKAAGRDEAAMRATDAPWPKSLDDLVAFIKAQTEGPHTYGTCVYAVSLATVAAFHYLSSELGLTVFQASCADLDVLRRTRHLKGPFLILKAEELLYPQYDLHAKLDEFIGESREWARKEAAKNLADKSNANVHPNVRARWEELAQAI